MFLRILLVFTLLIRLEPGYAFDDFDFDLEKENSEESSLLYFAIGVGTVGIAILSYLYMKSPEQRKQLWKHAKKYLPGFGEAIRPIVQLDDNVEDPHRYFPQKLPRSYLDGTESRRGFLNLERHHEDYILSVTRYQKETMQKYENALWQSSKLKPNAKHVRMKKAQQKSENLEPIFAKLRDQNRWISKRLKTAITFLNDENIDLRERLLTFMGETVHEIHNEAKLKALYNQLNARIQSELVICTSIIHSLVQTSSPSNLYKLYDFFKAYIQHVSRVLKKLENKEKGISEETRKSRRSDLVTYIHLFETTIIPIYEFLEPIVTEETLEEFRTFDAEILEDTADIRASTVMEEITPFDIYNLNTDLTNSTPEHDPSNSPLNEPSRSSSSSSSSDSGTSPISSAKKKRAKNICRDHSEKREGKKEEKKECSKKQRVLTPEQSQSILSTLNADQREIFESVFASRDYAYTSRQAYSLIEDLVNEMRSQRIDVYKDLQAMFLRRKGKEGIHSAHSTDTGIAVYGWVHQSIRSRLIRFGLFPAEWIPQTGKDCEAQMHYEHAMSTQL